MSAKANIDIVSMSDAMITQYIGTFVKERRLQLNKTQSQLATDSGLNRYTISQIENGEGCSLSSLIPVLRALDALYLMGNFKIEEEISPIEYVKMQKKKRIRASGKTNKDTSSEDIGW